MYFVNLPCSNSNISVPDVIYKVKPLVNTDLEIDVFRSLMVEQEDIIVKLRQLMVKLHNSSHKSDLKSKANNVIENVIQKNQDHSSVEDLIAAQDKVFRSLRVVEEKLDKIAFDNNIDIKNISLSDLLDAEQSSIFSSAIELNKRVDDCAIVNNVVLSSSVRDTIYISIHADVRNPPISLFLILGWLRISGRRVACISNMSSKLKSMPHNYIKDYINIKLKDTLENYELVVHLTWKQYLATGCLLINDICNETPYYGEMMSLLALCSFMDIDTSSKLSTLQHINEQLHESFNVKTAMASLNNKLYKEINARSNDNVAFSAFVASSLLQNMNYVKASGKLMESLQAFLEELSFDISSLIC